MTFRLLVNDSQLRDALVAEPPSGDLPVVSEPAESGFGESLYPILVEAGVVTLPAGVLTSVIASWLLDAWKRRGKPQETVVGVEAGKQSTTLVLSDGDVDQIAKRLLTLMDAAKNEPDGGA